MNKHHAYALIGGLIVGFFAYKYIQTIPPWSNAYQFGRTKGLAADA